MYYDYVLYVQNVSYLAFGGNFGMNLKCTITSKSEFKVTLSTLFYCTCPTVQCVSTFFFAQLVL